jgi:magnesium transporter
MSNLIRSTQNAQDKLHTLNNALDSGTYVQVKHMLASMPPADIAHLLESSPPHIRTILWKLIEPEDEGDILQHLTEDVRSHFLRAMNTDQLLLVLAELDIDDLADILQELPNRITQQILPSLDQQNRLRIEEVLAFPEDTAGGIMNTDTITVRPHVTLDVVLRYLRRHEELPENTDSILVINRRHKYVGRLSLAKLVTSDPSMTVREAMETNITPLPALTPSSEVAKFFERRDLVSAPVVDDTGKLVGRITVDDVLDVIREEADHSLLSSVGLDDDEDTFAPLLKSSRRRATWLGINLLTAVLASLVIGLFQDTIQQVVALAVLMPIVASMGGIAGTQTLTLVIRGIALGQIGWANAYWVFAREIGVGLINGLLWSAVIGVTAAWWFNENLIGYLIAAAMLLNLLIAAACGALIPLALKRLHIDPAIAGGVILTTFTDVVGFFAFLGLATLFYR